MLCLAAGLAGAACGSDDEGKPIPPDSATQLEGQLNEIDARLGNGSLGACNDVLRDDGGNVQPVEQLISNMPDDVDDDVVAALTDGFDRLFQLVQERCEELQSERDEQQPQQQPDEPEITIPEQTIPEQTETELPPETVPEPLPEEPEEGGPPPEENGDGGDGDGSEGPGQGGGGAFVPEGGG